MNDIWFVLFIVACVVCTGVMKYLVAQQAVKREFDAQKEWDRLSRAERCRVLQRAAIKNMGLTERGELK
tara:strand:- start:5 stop:211 length:207 start_codon:yes stop_codon:yes gene_type:complete